MAGDGQAGPASDRRESILAFETTLGGDTISGLLREAADVGLPVHIWYVGLAAVEQHIERVRARVRLGGHDIPEDAIRRRYPRSINHLVGLVGELSSLTVVDNSEEERDADGGWRGPRLVLRMVGSKIVELPDDPPAWAMAIVAEARRVDPGPPA